MGGTLLDRFLFSCWHQFSWPRRAESGEYYQVCLRCGAEYQYDWRSMRRTSRIRENAQSPVTEQAVRQTRKCGKQNGWSPRERRLKHEVELLYRVRGTLEWLQGNSENISRTGLLFRTAAPLEQGSPIEVILEMPVEISGQAGSNVLCFGNVVRVEPVAKQKNQFHVAIAIGGYEFLQNLQSA